MQVKTFVFVYLKLKKSCAASLLFILLLSFQLSLCSLFTVPSIPSLPSILSIPAISKIPSIPSIPSVPSLSSIPSPQLNKCELIERKAEAFYSTLSQSVLEDAMMSVPQLIKKYGYPSEVHEVISPDGYILTMHRIPYGRNGLSKNRPVVYLQHGILASSADWIIAGPNKGFAYILADAGFDVWMANSRGNRYSRRHTHLSPDNGTFWDFSWHNIAIYDVTTLIDYALHQSKQQKLFYVGHSQGTTVFYVMCSEKPEYNEKIWAMFGMAPIAYMSNIDSPLMRYISLGQKGLEVIFSSIGIHEFLPHSKLLAKVGSVLCNDKSVTQILCLNSLFAVCGYSKKQTNRTLIPIIMGHTPAGSATKQFLHYAQEINSGQFRQWDYGWKGNLEHYDDVEPPSYQLNIVTAPVYMFYSRNDWLSTEDDVARLYTELPNVQGIYLIRDKTFSHLDYVFGVDARKIIYNNIIRLILQH